MNPRLLQPLRGQLIVACSGGADSLALAHLAISRAKNQGLPMPLLLYVDHGLRPESAQEGAGVRDFAARHGARGLVERVEVERVGSLEEAAREARYAALTRCATQHGARWVLLAHTRSDQAETVLMRILRGTGVVGVSGMARQRGIFARPLLGISRSQTEDYCAQHQLVAVQDSMNRDARFTRVRLRHSLLPALRAENPRVDEALCGLADSARDHRAVLDWAASQVLSSRRRKRCLALDDGFRELPESLAIRALGTWVEEAGGGMLERSHLVALLSLVLAPRAGSRALSIPGGIIERRYDLLLCNPAPVDDYLVQVAGTFVTRRWRPGDRMRPVRLKGKSRKLSDLFADARVPAVSRPLAWVVISKGGPECDSQIVWAQHIGDALGWNVGAVLRRKPLADQSSAQANKPTV